MSLRRLKLDVIDLWQLHRIDAKVPRADQFGTFADMQKVGLIRHVGLSAVSVDDIRKAETVLELCEANGIGFIPWRPIDGDNLESTSVEFKVVMDKYEASASQIVLA